MNSEAGSIYCFDSSALIILQRYYSVQIVPDLWALLDKLAKEERLISHELVYHEIVPVEGEKDYLANWCISNRKIFVPQTQRQINMIGDILTNFPKLINPEYEKNQADPWLIAVMVERMEHEGLFGINSRYILVSMENTRSSQKIPAACKHYNINHMTINEFFNHNNIVFKI